MKFRTGEKIYGGIDLTLMILVLIGYHTNDDPNNYTIIINGVKRSITAAEAYIAAFILFVGVAGILWFIIRYFANKDNGKRDKK